MEAVDYTAGETFHSVLVTSGFADDRTRVLKHGDTFAVLDHLGGMKTGGLGEEGLYHEGTRFLARLSMDLEGKPLFFLGPTFRGENGELAVALTNPDLVEDDERRLPFGTLHFALRNFLWQGVCYRELHVKHYGADPIDVALSIYFAADFADIFEVRGMKRKARGVNLAPEVTRDDVILGYCGLDGVVRRTFLHFTPRPRLLESSFARFKVFLPPQGEATFLLTVACERGGIGAQPLAVNAARSEAQSEREKYRAWSCHLYTSNGQINKWIGSASADLQMMTTQRLRSRATIRWLITTELSGRTTTH